jgi:hypothetical protein
MLESDREWEREQKPEQHLHNRQRDAQLVQKLDQLAIQPVVGALPRNTVVRSCGCQGKRSIAAGGRT